MKDFGARSVPGIFVRMNQKRLAHYTRLRIIPSYQEFFFKIISGDVVLYEHVDRSEPDRSIPTLLMLPVSDIYIPSNL